MLEILFAIIGLVGATIWVVGRRTWQTAARTLAVLCIGAMGWRFWFLLHNGIQTKDDAFAVALFGAGGVAVVAMAAINRWGGAWRSWAIGAVAVALAVLMFHETQIPRPSSIAPLPAPTPVVAPTPVAVPSAPAARPRAVVRHRTSPADLRPTAEECDGYSEGTRRYLGCP